MPSPEVWLALAWLAYCVELIRLSELLTAPAKCHFGPLIPVLGEIRTFSFNFKGHERTHPNDGTQSQPGGQGDLPCRSSFCRLSHCKEESPLVENTYRPAVLQGDPVRPRSLSASEHPFDAAETLGTDASIQNLLSKNVSICHILR